MFKVLYWLLLDGFFAYILIGSLGHIGVGYTLFLLAAVAFFTWELVESIKNL